MKKHIGAYVFGFAALGLMALGCSAEAGAPETGTVGEQTEADLGTNPCTGYCSPFSDTGWVLGAAQFQSGNIHTGSYCRYTYNTVNGGTCGNMSGRTFKLNGHTMTCNWSNWTSIPASANGGWCVQVSAGSPDYASYTMWSR